MYSPLPPCPWADACIRAALEDGHHARLIYVTPFRDTPSLETLRDLRNVRWRAGGEMIAEKQWGTRRCRRDQNTQTDANRRRQRPWIKSSVEQSTRNWKQRGLGRGRKEGIRKRSLQREAEKTEVEEKRKAGEKKKNPRKPDPGAWRKSQDKAALAAWQSGLQEGGLSSEGIGPVRETPSQSCWELWIEEKRTPPRMK